MLPTPTPGSPAVHRWRCRAGAIAAVYWGLGYSRSWGSLDPDPSVVLVLVFASLGCGGSWTPGAGEMWVGGPGRLSHGPPAWSAPPRALLGVAGAAQERCWGAQLPQDKTDEMRPPSAAATPERLLAGIGACAPGCGSERGWAGNAAAGSCLPFPLPPMQSSEELGGSRGCRSSRANGTGSEACLCSRTKGRS